MDQNRLDSLMQIRQRKDDIDRLAQKYNVTSWRMFDHCLTFITGSHMLIEYQNMDATMWRKFREKLGNLFPFDFIEVYDVWELKHLVNHNMITQQKMDEILNEAKFIDDYFF